MDDLGVPPWLRKPAYVMPKSHPSIAAALISTAKELSSFLGRDVAGRKDSDRVYTGVS